MNKELALINLLKHCGVPYIWGGSTMKNGVDCSGYAQLMLAEIGMDPPGDQTAQGLFNHFKANGKFVTENFELWTLLFFGSSTSKITHIAIALGHGLMVEAGGGGSKTRTKADAEKIGAKVRVRNIGSRMDLVAAIKI